MKKNDEMILDSLREEIQKNAEEVQVPLRLQKESIVAMLKKEQENKEFSVETDKGQNSSNKIKYIQRMAATAAAMAIVLASVLVMKGNMPSAKVKLDSMALNGMSAIKLNEVSNSAELEKTINKILNKNTDSGSETGNGTQGKVPAQTQPLPVDSGKPQAATAPEAIAGYENFVLVKGKEPAAGSVLGISETLYSNAYEADIVKTAGNYLYVVSVVTDGETGLVSEEIKIIRKTPPEDMRVISTIRLADSDATENCIEIHVKNDLLIAIVNRMQADGAAATLAVYYSIAEPENPVKIREHVQDGEYVSSSIYGNNLCLVTDKTLEGSAENETAIPSFSVDGKKSGLEASEIKIVKDPDTSYIFITVTDVSDFSKNIGRLAVIGCGKNISCFRECVVIAREFVAANADENGNKSVKTEICRFNINGTEIVDAGAQLVDGMLAGSVSADEESRYIRAITVDGGVSNIYVFDEEMHAMSANSFSTEGEVKATKFIGNNGYIILEKNGKEQTVIIDFSNPEKPEGAGKVETEGFSDSLCLITDSLALGVRTEEVFVEKEIYVDGKNVDPDFAEEYSGPLETVRVKTELITFTLFDLTNSEKPVAVDSYYFAKGGEIEFALQDIEGMVIDGGEEIFAVPVIISNSETKKETSAYMVFDVSDKTLDKTMILEHSEDVAGDFASRGICTDGIFCTVSGNKVVAFSIKDGSVISGV